MLRSAKIAPCFPYEDLERFWRDADELGFHAVYDYDHFYGLVDPSGESLEAWTTLAAMAKVVERARVGCMVTGVTYRNPALLAKMAVTVDHISGGRLEFGLGAAWHEPEHRAYGYDFPPNATRIEMLDEALEVCKRLFTEERVTFEGRHFRLTDAVAYPKPVQKPYPPILVGGGGLKRTLRVVARHADEWNMPSLGEPEAWGTANKALDDHCAAVGRDPKEVRRSVQLFIHPQQEGQPEAELARLPEYEAAGCEHVVFSFYQPPARALLERFAPQ